MSYTLKFLSPAEIRRIADLSREMFEEGPQTVRTSEIRLEELFEQSPEEAALAQEITALNRDKKIELISLMYFGRGDTSGEEPEVGVTRLQRGFERESEQELVDKAVRKSPTLSTYLDNALRLLEA